MKSSPCDNSGAAVVHAIFQSTLAVLFLRDLFRAMRNPGFEVQVVETPVNVSTISGTIADSWFDDSGRADTTVQYAPESSPLIPAPPATRSTWSTAARVVSNSDRRLRCHDSRHRAIAICRTHRPEHRSRGWFPLGNDRYVPRDRSRRYAGAGHDRRHRSSSGGSDAALRWPRPR